MKNSRRTKIEGQLTATESELLSVLSAELPLDARMPPRDIDAIIDQIRARLPGVSIEQLQVRHPGADDDGLWFFSHPQGRFEAQLESPDGALPFLLESDGTPLRLHVGSVAEAVDAVVARLGLPSDHAVHGGGAAEV